MFINIYAHKDMIMARYNTKKKAQRTLKEKRMDKRNKKTSE